MMISGTTFTYNYAVNDTGSDSSGYGGAIYYACDTTNNCIVNISSENIVTYNSADNSGGGIFWS
jgi:hypothetical protein